MARIPNIFNLSLARNKVSQINGPSQLVQQTKDRQINDLQRAGQQAVAQVKALPFADGNMFTNITLAAMATTTFNHNLGRAYTGFIICRTRGTLPVSIVEIPQSQPALAASFISLKSNTDCVFDVWVY